MSEEDQRVAAVIKAVIALPLRILSGISIVAISGLVVIGVGDHFDIKRHDAILTEDHPRVVELWYLHNPPGSHPGEGPQKSTTNRTGKSY